MEKAKQNLKKIINFINKELPNSKLYKLKIKSLLNIV